MGTSPNGIEIPKQKFLELQRQCRHHNVFPIFLPNAFFGRKPAPVFETLSPIVDSIVGELECLNPSELSGELERLPGQIRMLLGEDLPRIAKRDYLERMALYLLAWSLSNVSDGFKEAIRPFATDCEVGRAFPDLAKHIDEEGLLVLGPEFEIHDGGINYHENVLHFHQCLRRGFTSNPNFDFTAKFASYYRELKSKADFRIAIDPRRFMHQSEYQQMMEFDTWYGSLFSREHLDDLSHAGLTVIERERPSLFDFDNKIDRTEFYWASDQKSGIKSFEIEELTPEEVSYDSFRITRYIHSERDTRKKTIRHFDGAAKVYESLGSYRRRLESNLPKEPRADQKPKLFRIDGDIPVDAWIDLTSMFFKGNEMVLRYYDPSGYEMLFRDKIQAFQNLKIDLLKMPPRHG